MTRKRDNVVLIHRDGIARREYCPARINDRHIRLMRIDGLRDFFAPDCVSRHRSIAPGSPTSGLRRASPLSGRGGLVPLSLNMNSLRSHKDIGEHVHLTSRAVGARVLPFGNYKLSL